MGSKWILLSHGKVKKYNHQEETHIKHATKCGLTATHEVHQRVGLKFCLLKSIQVQVHAPLGLRLAGHFLAGQNLVARVQLYCSWDGSHVSVCASLHFQWRNLQESYSCGILQKTHGSDDEVAYNTCCSYDNLRLSPLTQSFMFMETMLAT